MFSKSRNSTYDGIKNHDKQSIEDFVIKNFRSIQNFVRKNSGDENDAWDLFQSSFEIFYNNIKSGVILSGQASLQKYFFTICKNKWHEYLRYRKRSTSTECFNDYAMAVNPGEDLDTVNIEAFIKKLDETCRELLIAYYFHQLSMQDIAEELGFNNANTTKSKKNKCMNKLKTMILENRPLN